MGRFEIDPRFEVTANAPVLEFLRRTMPSAHSDVAGELSRSAKGLDGVSFYCPDPGRYAFVLLHLTDFSVVGLAYGQSRLVYRLPNVRIREAIEDGGLAATELGPCWIFFPPWSNDEPLQQSRRRLARWCSIAVGRAPRMKAP